MTTLPGQRYDEYGFVVAAKGPRPEVHRGATILMIGGAGFVVGAFLPWYQAGSLRLTGMDTFINNDGTDFVKPGVIWIVLGAILLALGAVSFFAARHLAVAVAAVVVAVVGVFASLIGVGVAKSQHDNTGGVGDAGPGAFVGIIAILVALAGSVHILSKRRR